MSLGDNTCKNESNDTIYKNLIYDKIIVKTMVDVLPSKLRLFPLYSINNLEPILIESNNIPPQLEQRCDYFSNSVISSLFNSREKIIAVLQKPNLDEKQKTDEMIAVMEEYLKDLLNGEYFNTTNYTTKLNNDVKYGIFLWGHHVNNTYYSYTDPWNINKPGVVNFSQLPSSILSAKTNKQSDSKSLIHTMLYPREDFIDKNGKCAKKIHHIMANSIHVEKFYMYYNLTGLYLKKFILKLKYFDESLFNEIEKEQTSAVYKDTLSLLHIKAKHSLSCCINLAENKFIILEDLESITSNEYIEQKQILSIKFLKMINSILVFFGQILMFAKAFIKLPQKMPDKLEETTYLLVSILNYLKESFLKNEEFVFVFKTLFDDDPPRSVIEALINFYTSYLCYSKFFPSDNSDSVFMSEAIFYLDQSRDYLKIKSKQKMEKGKSKLDEIIFKLAFSEKMIKSNHKDSLTTPHGIVLLKKIELIHSELMKINEVCYYQPLIQLTEQEITARKKIYKSVSSMRTYIYENSYYDNDSTTITSGDEQFSIELIELIKKYKSTLSIDLLNKKLSNFV